MRFAYAAANPQAFSMVWDEAQPIIAALAEYSGWLTQVGPVIEPRGMVFLDLPSATDVFSTHVLPAWTNESLIYLDPMVRDWQQIYLSALTTAMPPATQGTVADYYRSLDARDVATIAAHELTHHLRAFEEADSYEDTAWFEEGFCFYAPRAHLLSRARLAELREAERALIAAHAARLGGHPVWQFGLSNTGASFADALFDYWRAIHTVSTLGEVYTHGNIRDLLALFEQWSAQSRDIRLDTYLVERLGVSREDQEALWLR